MLYGSDTWVLTKREENHLLVFERKVLRKICRPKIENGVDRRRYNHELDKEFNSPSALNATKTSRLCYAGHMIRRPEPNPIRVDLDMMFILVFYNTGCFLAEAIVVGTTSDAA
jgi:hypothetical protein